MVFTAREGRQLLAVLVLIVLVGVGIFRHPPYWALGLALGITVVWARAKGVPGKELVRPAWDGVSRSRNPLLILFLVSILMGLWKQNGTVATLIYHGFGLIFPGLFLPTVFVFSSLVSMLLGTAIGTAGTVGLVFMGVGEAVGLPKALVAGTIIGGAFVGDRSAPTSGPVFLTAAATDTPPGVLLPYLFTTLGPTYILALAGYLLLGIFFHSGPLPIQLLQHYQQILAAKFTLQWFLLIPPVLLLTLALTRVKIILNLLVTVVVTIVTSLWVGLSIGGIGGAAFWGFQPAADLPMVAVLAGGGIVSLRNLYPVVITAMALTGVLESTGVLEKATAGILERIKTIPQLVGATVLFSIGAGVIACTQAVAIVAPGAVFRPHYRRLGVDPLVLARAIADSGIPVSGIIPWSIAALTPALILGVPVTALAPYALFCWLSPVVSVTYALVGKVKETPAETSTSA